MSYQRSQRGSGVRSLWTGLAVALSLLCATVYAHGQKATERYIPIGQSPGVSRTHTWIGEITEVDARARTVTIADSAGTHTVQITEKTRIWLDRSKLKKTNLTGRFADLQKGRMVEVKYESPERRDAADWVKVEIAR
jgi:hypothetical protein